MSISLRSLFFLLAFFVLLFVFVTPAQAQSVPMPSCPLTKNATTDVAIFSTDSNRTWLNTHRSAADSVGGPFFANLSAGTYKVTLFAWDGSVGRASQKAQPNEEYIVEFADSTGKVLASSGRSKDIADGVEEASTIKVTNQNLVIPSKISKLFVRHPEYPSTAQSVAPVCASFEKLPPPPPTGVWCCVSSGEVGNFCEKSLTGGSCSQIGSVIPNGGGYRPNIQACAPLSTCDPIGLICTDGGAGGYGDAPCGSPAPPPTPAPAPAPTCSLQNLKIYGEATKSDCEKAVNAELGTLIPNCPGGVGDSVSVTDWEASLGGVVNGCLLAQSCGSSNSYRYINACSNTPPPPAPAPAPTPTPTCSLQNLKIYGEATKSDCEKAVNAELGTLIPNCPGGVGDSVSVTDWEASLGGVVNGCLLAQSCGSSNSYRYINACSNTPPPPAPAPAPTPISNKFNIGGTVKVLDPINVRATAGGTKLGSQPVGRTGVVTGGPQKANGFVYWQINYSSGVDGWSAEDWLGGGSGSTPPPTPPPPPTSTPPPTSPPSTKFDIGDGISVKAWVNVRSTPNGDKLGSQRPDITGTVIGGPVEATNGYVYWQINYDTGADGWSAEDWLGESSGSTPPPPPTEETAQFEVGVDPVDSNYAVSLSFTNVSSNLLLSKITIEVIGGGEFDWLTVNGATRAPSIGWNGDYISSTFVTITPQNALSPGQSLEGFGDVDGSVTGYKATAFFSNGSEVSGSLVNVGDADDNNSDYWVLSDSNSTPPPPPPPPPPSPLPPPPDPDPTPEPDPDPSTPPTADYSCKTTYKVLNFEDGVIPGGSPGSGSSAWRNEPYPTIYQESGGNHYLRITATEDDIFTNTQFSSETRARSQLWTGAYRAEEGDTAIYAFQARIDANNTPKGPSVLYQNFQYGTCQSGGYGAVDCQGPPVWINYGDTGNLTLRNYYNGGADFKQVNLGKAPIGTYFDVVVRVKWTLTNSGRVEAYINGKLAGVISGVPTLLHPESNKRAEFHVGTYGDGAIGTVDFDNIIACRE